MTALHNWYESDKTENEPIISSRIRLARNLKGYNFQKMLSEEDAHKIIDNVHESIRYRAETSHSFDKYELSKLEQQMFLEKHIISPKFLLNKAPKAIYATKDKNISIMINEEDHVRIQAIYPGRDICSALSNANNIDDSLEQDLEFSFDSSLGYLTSCPTNVGTGMRASYLIHLPCLDKTGAIKKLFPHIAEQGLTLRGIYGEGTIPMGSIYQISNQATTGKSESQIIKNLDFETNNLIAQERYVMDKILSTRQNYLEDKAYRAHAILSACRSISIKEAMNLLSDVRLGFVMGILDRPKPNEPMYKIMMSIQPGHLHINSDKIMDEPELDIVRADYLRSVFTIVK